MSKNSIMAQALTSLHPNIHTSCLAFVFPGQGSQSIGMLASLAQQFPVLEQTFAEASAVLNYDLWQLIQQGPEEALNQTEKTQPALLAASVALWRLWRQQDGARPGVLAGHSLGEYSALVCANAMDFQDAIKLVAARGHFMQEAVPASEGAMAAIVGLEDNVINTLCEQAAQGEVVMPANFNAIGQIVISGNIEAVKRALELAKQAGAKIAKLLPVSVPSHSALMKPAAARLADSLAKISLRTPEIPVIHNIDLQSHADNNQIRQALVEQLYMPVRWVETIQLFAKRDIKIIIECGAGKVLAGLNKRITADLQTLPINDAEQLQQALEITANCRVAT